MRGIDSGVTFLRAHFAAVMVLFALAVGALYLLPSIFLGKAVERTGNEFLIAQVTHHGDTAIYYVPRAQEMAEGHFPVSDLHVAEYKNSPFIFPPGPQIPFAAFIRLTGDVNSAILLVMVVFSLVMFVLLFWVGMVFLGHRLGALLFASVGVLTPVLIHLPRGFFSLQLFGDIIAKNFFPLVRTPIHQLFLSRIEDPLLTLWLFIIVFLLTYLFWRNRTMRSASFLGVAVGALLYFYLYYWIFSVALIIILFGHAVVWQRERNIVPWIVVLTLLGVLALPYVINFLELNKLPQAGELTQRIGFEAGRGFRLSVWRDYAVYLILGMAAFFLLGRKDREPLVFFLAALVVLVLLWNLQLILGWNIQPDHWTKVAGLPIFTLCSVLIAAILGRLRSVHPRRFSDVAVAAVALTLLVLLYSKKVVNVLAFRHPSDQVIQEYSFPSDVYDSWRWLDGHVPAESIILSNSFITSLYLTGNTRVNPYLPHVQNTLMSNRNLEDRFLVSHKLFGTSPDQLRVLLTYKKNLAELCPSCDNHTRLNIYKAPTYLYAHTFNAPKNSFDALTRDASYAIPPPKIDELAARYRGLNVRWEDFRGDYVYSGPWERELSNIDLGHEPALERIYTHGRVEIYRLR